MGLRLYPFNYAFELVTMSERLGLEYRCNKDTTKIDF